MSTPEQPCIACAAGIRYCALYWIPVTISISSKKDDNDDDTSTFIERLLYLEQQQNKKFSSRMPSIRWWIQELEQNRVTLEDGIRIHGNNMISTKTTAADFLSKSCRLRGNFHFHEQSILFHDLPEILYEDSNYLIVNKPAGVDVLENPAVGRVHNSLPGLLHQKGFTDLKPAHRLDCPVSGIVCCGKTSKDTKRLSRRMELGQTNKTYIARVLVPEKGLPSLPLIIEHPLSFDKTKSLAFVDTNHGKASKTTIVECCENVVNDGTAVVVIQLHTGRKHQIRAHLHYVGMPIANDVRYGGTIIPEKLSAFGLPHPPSALCEAMKEQYVADCEYCRFERNLVLGNATKDKGPCVNPGIWLHSWRYEFPTLKLKFESPLPQWAILEKEDGQIAE